MTTEVHELPEVGDIVIATIKEVTGHGAYVTLDEYGGITGFLHISEIATGWIRNIERYVKPGQKSVLKVIRVNKARAEVDLSLKQVGGEEKKAKLMEVKKDEKVKAFLELIKERCKLSDEQVKKYADIFAERYDDLYDLFEDVGKRGAKALEGIAIPPEVVAAIEEVSSKIPIPSVEVRGVMEITCPKPDGIEIIRQTLMSVEESRAGAGINISYIGAPKYRLMVSAENFKVAEKALNAVLQKIQDGIEKHGGTFKFTREESKKGVKA
jgi:translation initiation factor 2 subunit 1